ncbi:MAG: hypothetical protein V9G20_00645 [Candidatus Promineifilaceae bacterium]
MRLNPFQALTEAEWAEIAVWPVAAATAFATSAHLQFLGPMGSGKTTLLRACHARLRFTPHCRVAWEYLAKGQYRRQTPLNNLDVFLLDEAQRLWWWERQKWVAAACHQPIRYLFTSHQDLTPLFQRYHQPLTTIHLDTPTQEHLYAMLTRRITYFNSHTTLTPEALDWLWQQFAPCWRDMEYFLYEVWQYWGEKTVIGVEELEQMR